MSELQRSPSVGTITKGKAGKPTEPVFSAPAPTPADKIKSQTTPAKIKETAPVSPQGVEPPTEGVDSPKEVKEGVDKKQKSFGSLRSDDGAGSGGREINDTLFGRFRYIQYSFISLAIISLLLWILFALHSKEGITVPLGGETFRQTIPVILEIWMHLCFISTDTALSRSLAAYFGYQLSQKRGYSLIVCGFIQGDLFSKIQFSNLLNFRSKYKKVISRASTLWLVHVLMLILTFFSSTAVVITTTRYDAGTLLCVEYGQDGVPIDREWPTIETQAGVAEFVFGSSLGALSSEEAIQNTTFYGYPQLIDACQDGTEIMGKGFTSNFQTTCECSATNSLSDLRDSGIPQNFVAEMSAKNTALNGGMGWVNSIAFDEVAGNIMIYTILSGNNLCGGAYYDRPSIPICKTNIVDHNFATVKISWMNDGRNVRSTPNRVGLVKLGSPANMTWLYVALVNAYEGTVSSHTLQGIYPGTVNPLFWWTTSNFQNIAPSYLQAGLETSVAMMMKIGIGRTYSVTGNSCVQNLEDPSKTTLNITDNGLMLGLIFALFELFLCAISFAGCIPWFSYQDPIIPAVRLVSDRTYFNIMLCKNSTGNMLRIIGSTADRNDIWPKLDIVVRVGENIQTVADTEQGEIIVDKPKLVTNLSWTKTY